MKDRKLGLGLEALLGAAEPAAVSVADPRPAAPAARPAPRPEGVAELPLSEIRPNPYQPRTDFDEEDIRALAASIKSSGLIQPIVVRRSLPGYELVAGERRFRAAKLLGLASLPAVVRDVDERRMLQLALVENLQRRDLNPIEKAKAFRRLLQSNTWSQEQVAEAVGMNRSTVANFMRLLELPAEVQEAVSRGTISMGHARALLATSNAALQRELLRRIVAEDLSVRVVEKLATPAGATTAASKGRKDANLEDLERRFTQFFGTRVDLVSKKRGGRIVVNWFTNDQFNGIVRKLGI